MRLAHLAPTLALALVACPPDEDPWADPPEDPNAIDCTTAPHQDRCRRDGAPEGQNLEPGDDLS
jgi:hypothetical protein